MAPVLASGDDSHHYMTAVTLRMHACLHPHPPNALFVKKLQS